MANISFSRNFALNQFFTPCLLSIKENYGPHPMRIIYHGIFLLIMAMACCSGSTAEMREFVDVRMHGGLVENKNVGGGITLMAGNLGMHDATIDVPDDVGVVLGLRGSASRLRMADGDDDRDTNVANITGLIGFGYYINRTQHAELCLGYGRGLATDRAKHGGLHNDGKTTVWSGELGWYRTSKRGYQLGVLSGWSWTKADFNADANLPKMTYASNGMNIAFSLGYRF